MCNGGAAWSSTKLNSLDHPPPHPLWMLAVNQSTICCMLDLFNIELHAVSRRCGKLAAFVNSISSSEYRESPWPVHCHSLYKIHVIKTDNSLSTKKPGKFLFSNAEQIWLEMFVWLLASSHASRNTRYTNGMNGMLLQHLLPFQMFYCAVHAFSTSRQ